MQFALLCLFFWLNYSSVKTFAKSNNLISLFKFVVPLLVIGVLFTFFKPENFHVQGFALSVCLASKWRSPPAASSSPTWG